MKLLFALYLLVLLKVIVFKYPLGILREIAGTWSKEVLWEGLSGASYHKNVYTPLEQQRSEQFWKFSGQCGYFYSSGLFSAETLEAHASCAFLPLYRAYLYLRNRAFPVNQRFRCL